jgi:carbon-monoxide dehydrogenase medium subunit
LKLVATAGFIPTSFSTLPRFRLVRAANVAAALTALGDAERPAILAGGTDLPARFNEGFAPTDLVDVSRVAALRDIMVTDRGIEIGATVTHAAGSTHPVLHRHLPSLAEAWARIANVRVRLSATLGGNLMARRTRYEGSILLSALAARARFAASSGAIELPVEDIWSADLPRDALLTAIVVPLRRGLRLDYARDLRPVMTQAVALDDAGEGRAVLATEHVVPSIRALDGAEPHGVWDDLDIADPVTGAGYVRQVGSALLRRQLTRLRRQ